MCVCVCVCVCVQESRWWGQEEQEGEAVGWEGVVWEWGDGDEGGLCEGEVGTDGGDGVRKG